MYHTFLNEVGMVEFCLFSPLSHSEMSCIFFRCGFSVCYLPRSHCNAPWVVGVGGYLLHHAADSGNRQRCEDAPTHTHLHIGCPSFGPSCQVTCVGHPAA